MIGRCAGPCNLSRTPPAGKAKGRPRGRPPLDSSAHGTGPQSQDTMAGTLARTW